MAPSSSRRLRRRILPLLLVVATGAAGALLLGPRIVGAPMSDAEQPPSAAAAVPTTASAVPSPSVATPPPTPFPTPVPSTPPPTPAPTTTPVPERLSATASRREALADSIDRLRERAGIPGVSVAIIFPDGTVWLGQSGLADIERRIPVAPDTAFAIASVSKTFTAALILDLVDDGLLTLDERVTTYLPDLDLAIDPKTTVRQLLDHTSGLRDYFFDPRIDRALLSATDARWTAARALGYVGKPYFKPGRGWHYSNTNYLVLGLVAEAVSGETVADLYRTRFLVPLGLRDTVYQPAGPSSGPVALGYRFASASLKAPAIDLSDGTGVVPFTSVVTAAAAAGGIASSARDIARWARAIYGGEALSAAALGAMLGDIERTHRLNPSISYGLGVQAIEIDGRLTYGHSGRLLGFRAVMRHLPQEGLTIAVLTNQSRADPATIARALLRVALRPIEHCTCTGRD